MGLDQPRMHAASLHQRAVLHLQRSDEFNDVPMEVADHLDVDRSGGLPGRIPGRLRGFHEVGPLALPHNFGSVGLGLLLRG